MHHVCARLHHESRKCTMISGVAPGFIKKCTSKIRNAPSFFWNAPWQAEKCNRPLSFYQNSRTKPKKQPRGCFFGAPVGVRIMWQAAEAACIDQCKHWSIPWFLFPDARKGKRNAKNHPLERQAKRLFSQKHMIEVPFFTVFPIGSKKEEFLFPWLQLVWYNKLMLMDELGRLFF